MQASIMRVDPGKGVLENVAWACATRRLFD